jgi:hypothetical protein
MQHVFYAVEKQGMAGVGAALEAGHYIVGGGKYVYNLAFAFIAPLEAY